MITPFVPDIERFWRKVTITDTCWLWQGSNWKGYGQLQVDGKLQAAYRFSYDLFVAPIPPSYEVDHLCRVPACVKPSHLEAVPRAENVRRQWVAYRQRPPMTCLNGHTYAPDQIQPPRRCLTCKRASSRLATRAYRERLKAAGPREP